MDKPFKMDQITRLHNRQIVLLLRNNSSAVILRHWLESNSIERFKIPLVYISDNLEQPNVREHDMKKSILASICALGMLTLVGCASDYLISTNDGRMIDSQDKPEIDEDTGMIMYEDEEGRENQIPQSDVKEIMER